MTFILVGKIWLLITVANFTADVAVTLSDISKCCMGTPNIVCLFIEINNKRTFWPSFTEVVLLLVGQILTQSFSSLCHMTLVTHDSNEDTVSWSKYSERIRKVSFLQVISMSTIT